MMRRTRAGAALGLITLLLAAGPFPPAPPAVASPLSLRRELARFSASPETTGLSFCAVFAPLIPAAGGLQAMGATGARAFAGAPVEPGSDSSSCVAFGAATPLIPASLNKLTTSSLALERLGSGFTFTTRILADSALQEGVLHGDLIVHGGGDPFMVSERLWLLAHQLSLAGLKKVTGRLILDASLLDPAEEDPARTLEREKGERAYAARLSAFPVNFNAAAFHIAPGTAVGSPALVTADPYPCSYIRLVNHLTTCPKDSSETWKITLSRDDPGECALVVGRVPEGSGGQVVYRSVSNPDRFAVALFRAFLLQAGILVDGPGVVETGRAPVRILHPRAKVLLEFPSLPLSTLLVQMNHYSNNLMADQIAMVLADTTRANLTRGGSALTEWLRSRSGGGPEIGLRDGSGLNPADRLTGQALIRLLIRDWWDLRVQPDLVSSLPMPREDGTLKRRFAEDPVPQIRAKTGTMAEPSASGIAGYLQHPEIGPVAFVVLMNAGASGGWTTARMLELQEKWVREYLRSEQ